MQCFHQGATNWATSSRIPILHSLIHQIWDDLFLKETKIICSVKQDLNFEKQEHQVGSLNDCIGELQQQAYAQRLELQDAQHGCIESRREQVRRQQEISVKEEILRNTQIRSLHEMGEMKRAEELRVAELSVPRSRGNHETIQRLTFQLQAMQD